MLGLNFPLVTCDKCFQGRTLDRKEIVDLEKNKDSYFKKIKCSCGNEFTYLEGIIQDIIRSDSFGDLHFTNDIFLSGVTEIKIGYTHFVEFEQVIPVVSKIFLTNYGKFAAIEPKPCGSVGFQIFSAEDKLSDLKIGDKHTVSWAIYGKSTNINRETWNRLLVQAKEQLMNKQFNLAYLTSEIAFESFIDSLLNKLLVKKGLSEEAAYTIVESIGSIKTKVHKLLKQLDKVIFRDSGKINKQWEDIVAKRNKIAHGEVAEIEENEARNCFESIVRGIFYIIINSTIE